MQSGHTLGVSVPSSSFLLSSIISNACLTAFFGSRQLFRVKIEAHPLNKVTAIQLIGSNSDLAKQMF